MSVGFVLVSHSARLAEGVRELAEQVAQGNVPMVAVGGAEDGSLGTNALAIAQAIESLSMEEEVEGILVLMDLGSAVLSAETALEQLDEVLRDRVRMADAPFVEGAIAAAVEASLGSGLEAVLTTAEAARSLGKLS
ncbi:MAG: PTS mannose transporter subunit IID [Candidatus Nephthysia bennettiae]|uniref:phosphoenolpyruvate--glycerone phosphotransferase n=1 Tax=Candidatus Nephthysia bennettiae TaxID=3127016 RepID=A0A934NAC0_9BACT|nr:PTS-dependent dihydroxyacetone kinase phosphotransferase subunit DhaM [Candidatus Dormibacteraeota bacterium]MBJ7614850.1 PTS-dependent dihydroxyacetone kinase phosphotransferase subunit DhaM [Candidatus Dormibacteraeota bacterium]PZR88339.1 MAG: PTS mannose transporter subunit IID [Candidatus Dormibacteraeota bacterium]